MNRIISAKTLILVALLLPFALSLTSLVKNTIPFWFDPARDLLLASANLQKPTLIGPESGIPKIFYGPHWIWLVSAAQLISRDPAVVTFLIQTLPYFFVFPLLLYKVRWAFPRHTLVFFFSVFFLTHLPYTNHLWNPHLSPIIFLALIVCLTKIAVGAFTPKNLALFFASGVTVGLLINTHPVFGIATFFIPPLYVLVKSVLPARVGTNLRWLAVFMAIYLCAVLFVCLPFVIFELRHGGDQIRAIVDTLANSLLYNSAVVGKKGLDQTAIILRYLGTIAPFFNLSKTAPIIIYAFVAGFLLGQHRYRKIKLFESEASLITLCLITTLVFLALFLASKNPIWDYHFIGLEPLFLLTLGLIAKKYSFFKNLFLLWLLINLATGTLNLLDNLRVDPLTFDSLALKKAVVATIFSDPDSETFAVAAYSPAIYTHEYDYLLTSKDRKIEKDLAKATTIYLIIPPVAAAVSQDFINYRTPNTNYATVQTWPFPDGTTLLKRAKKPTIR